ncbi:MAG TPA: hypothetical protein VE974_12410 [Thermoanaerobaculia bacterium]|nr:hypothetical protein [Thermoanaerobaculia bacterium]
MKASFRAFAAVGVLLMLSPGALFADCPDIVTQGCCGGVTWKKYTFTTDCPTVSGGISVTSTNSCSLGDMHEAANDPNTETVTYQYTIPSTSTGWQIRLDYDFNNGGDSSNFIQASYNVTRGGSSIDSGTFLNRSDSWPCGVASDWPNSWNAGDILTVTISLRATNSSSYARADGLILFKSPA